MHFTTKTIRLFMIVSKQYLERHLKETPRGTSGRQLPKMRLRRQQQLNLHVDKSCRSIRETLWEKQRVWGFKEMPQICRASDPNVGFYHRCSSAGI